MAPSVKKPPAAAAAPNRNKKILAIVSALAVIGIGGTVFAVLASGDEPEKPSYQGTEEIGVPLAQASCSPVERPKYQGRVAVQPGEEHPAYSSNPPTSGWYQAPRLDGSFFMTWPTHERLVTTIADGGVVIYTSEEEAVHGRRYKVLVKDNSVQGVLDKNLEKGVVFTAWGVLQRCEKFSGDAAQEFVAQFGGGKALKALEPNAKPITEG